MEKVKIKIDNQEIEVEKGITVLEAAKKLNKLIPTFCYHEKLPIFGGCRICLVWDVKARRSIIACGSYVYDGMEIETENEKVKEDRKFILQMLFSRHPLDCPICDKAGECDLQNWGTYWGPQQNLLPITPFEKIRPEDDWESDYLEFVSNRCVLCIKCVSVCNNIVGANALYQLERGFETLISPVTKPMDTSSCEMCGLCVDICPVGAILFKPFKFNARPWLLKETFSHCGMCSLNCPVVIDHDGKDIYRIRSTADLNICAGAYLGYDVYKENRLKYPLIQNQVKTIDEAIQKVADIINNEETAIILSSYSNNESLDIYKEIIEKSGIKATSLSTINTIPVLAGYKETAGEDYTIDLSIIKEFQNVFIIGDDIADTTPVLSYMLNGKNITYIGKNANRIKKFFPRIEEKLNIEDIPENSLIIYSTTSDIAQQSYEMGNILGKLKKEKNCNILIIPFERNSYGLINRFENLYYLPDILKDIEEGKIKNLVIIGEEITDYIGEEKLKYIFQKVENLIVFSPFEDGLTLISNIAIPISLWFEEEGYIDSIFGKVKTKKSIKNIFEEKTILQKLNNLIIRKEKPQIDYSIRFYDTDYIVKPEIKIWDFGYIGKRSNNLLNWKIKNLGVLEDAD